MKKYIGLLILLLVLSGCGKEEKKEKTLNCSYSLNSSSPQAKMRYLFSFDKEGNLKQIDTVFESTYSNSFTNKDIDAIYNDTLSSCSKFNYENASCNASKEGNTIILKIHSDYVEGNTTAFDYLKYNDFLGKDIDQIKNDLDVAGYYCEVK